MNIWDCCCYEREFSPVQVHVIGRNIKRALKSIGNIKMGNIKLSANSVTNSQWHKNHYVEGHFRMLEYNYMKL